MKKLPLILSAVATLALAAYVSLPRDSEDCPRPCQTIFGCMPCPSPSPTPAPRPKPPKKGEIVPCGIHDPWVC